MEPQTRTRTRRIHWSTPGLLLTSLLVGVCLGIGHHAFYQSLNGSTVSSEPMNLAGWSTSKQQLISVGGTAIAFIFKASLVLCATIAYMQLFFHAIVNEDFTIQQLDRWFTGLEDIRSLFCVSTYWRFPGLTLVALTAWLLPLAAIFSPSSLSVQFNRLDPAPTSLEHVPQPAFRSLAFGTLSPKNGNRNNITSGLFPHDPGQEVNRIVNAVASGGAILPIKSPGTNASWTVTIELPKLSCAPFSADMRRKAEGNLLAAIHGTREAAYTSNKLEHKMFAYLAWMNGPEPFQRDDSGTWHLAGIEGHMTNTVELFAAIVPRARDYTVPTEYNGITPGTAWFVGEEAYNKTVPLLFSWYMETATFFNCRLGAANYTLHFSYVNDNQNIDILRVEATSPVERPGDLMNFGVASNGSLQYDREDANIGNGTDMRLVSYTAIYRSLLDTLGGAYNYGQDSVGYLGRGTLGNDTYSTRVFWTSLVHSKELSELKLWHPTAANISNATSGMAYDTAQSLLPMAQTWENSGRSILEMLDELFFNITVSMASSEAFLYNQSSPFAPPPQNVTFNLYGNVYSYDAQKLWLAYGIALGVSLLNLTFGLWAILSVGGSFSADFSSVARIARNSNIDADLREDMAGVDPLPKYMAMATLRLNQDEQLEIGKPKLIETVREVRPSER